MNWDQWIEDRTQEVIERISAKRPVNGESYLGFSVPRSFKTKRETLVKILNGTYHQEVITNHGKQENIKRFRRANFGFVFVVVG
jgi:hypothetical protein